MSYGLYLSAEGAHAQTKRLETIANNLANVDTVGFKRQLAVFQARYAEAIEEGKSMPGMRTLDDLGGGVMVQQMQTDFSQGSIKATKMPTDMAIQGEGFFKVRKGEEEFLTRAGNFRLTPRGELMTQDGFSVLDDSDNPVVLDRPGAPFQVTPRGEIRQGNETRTLALVAATPDQLQPVGENLFRASGETRAIEDGKRDVASGCVETSGVVPTTEVVEMIETQRVIEANLNMMQTQDQMLGGLVGRLLKVS